MSHEQKCGRCITSKCCSYTTEALGEIEDKEDFDHLLWQISHQGVEVYKSDGDWYLLIDGKCEHLDQQGGCGIYEKRPQVCRDYNADWCEFDESAVKGFELYFRNYKELLNYCLERFDDWEEVQAN